MFFLLRSVFWLGLIMIIIWWSGADRSRKPGASDAKLQSLSVLAGKGLEEAKSRLEQACLQRPKLCIELFTQNSRTEAERPQTHLSISESANKANAGAKHQGRAAQTAPQGRDPAN